MDKDARVTEVTDSAVPLFDWVVDFEITNAVVCDWVLRGHLVPSMKCCGRTSYSRRIMLMSRDKYRVFPMELLHHMRLIPTHQLPSTPPSADLLVFNHREPVLAQWHGELGIRFDFQHDRSETNWAPDFKGLGSRERQDMLIVILELIGGALSGGEL